MRKFLKNISIFALAVSLLIPITSMQVKAAEENLEVNTPEITGNLKITTNDDGSKYYELTIDSVAENFDANIEFEVGGYNQYHTQINEVILGESVTRIPANAFVGWSSLKEISAPGVTEIGEFALSKSGIETLNFKESFPKMTKVPGKLFCPVSIGSAEEIPEEDYSTSLKNVNLEGVTEVGAGAFLDCINLTDVNFGNVETIRDGAFFNSGITTVNSSNITTLESTCFGHCYNLTTVELPNVTTIPDMAFTYCDNLESVSLPKVTSIEEGAFNKCTNLSVVNATDVVTLSEEVDDISSKYGAFESCTSLVNVNFPNVTKIGLNAFKDCSSLESLNIPKVTNVDAHAFNNCTKLGSIDLSQVQELKLGTFYNCKKLSSVSIPKVTVIGESAFYRCSELNSIDIPKVVDIEDSAFKECTSLANVDLSKVMKIGCQAFLDCTSLEAIDLTSVTGIEIGAFRNCSSLNTIYGNYTVFSAAKYDIFGFYKTLEEWEKPLTKLIGDRSTDFVGDDFEAATQRVLPEKFMVITANYSGEPVYEEKQEDGSYSRFIIEDNFTFDVNIQVYSGSTGSPEASEGITYSVDRTDFENGLSDSVTISAERDGVSNEVAVTIPTTRVESEISHIYSNLTATFPAELDVGIIFTKEIPTSVEITVNSTYNSGRTDSASRAVTADEWDYYGTVINIDTVKFGDNPITIRLLEDINQTYSTTIAGVCTHSETHKGNVINATCDADGSYDVICNTCGAIIEDDVAIPMVGHKYQKVAADDGTISYTCNNDAEHVLTADDVTNDVTEELVVEYVFNPTLTTLELEYGGRVNKADFTVHANHTLTLVDGSTESCTESLPEFTWKIGEEELGETYEGVGEDVVITFESNGLSKGFPVDAEEAPINTKYTITGIVKSGETPKANYYVYCDDTENVIVTDDTGVFTFNNLLQGDHKIFFYEKSVSELITSTASWVQVHCENDLAKVTDYNVLDGWKLSESSAGTVATVNMGYIETHSTITGKINVTGGTLTTPIYVFADSLSNYCRTTGDGSFQFDLTTGNHTIYITKLTDLPTVALMSTRASSIGLPENSILATVDLKVNSDGTTTHLSDNSYYPVTVTDGATFSINTTVPYSALGEAGTENPGDTGDTGDDEDLPNPGEETPGTSDPDTVKGSVKGYVKIPSNSWSPTKKLVFLDGPEKYTAITNTGYYSFNDIPAGNHSIYFTKYTNPSEVDLSKNMDEQAEISAYITVGTKGSTVFRSDNSSSYKEQVTCKQSMDENTKVLTLSYTIGKAAGTGEPEYTGEGIRVKGTLSSKNGLFSNRMILLDNYETWNVGDADGSFYFDYVTEGKHTLYITKNIKSAMLGTSGPVKDEEPCYIKVEFELEYDFAEQLKYTRVVDSEDYTSCTYAWSSPAFDDEGVKTSSGILSYAFTDNSTNVGNKEGVNITLNVASDNFNVASKNILLDNYDTWIALNKSGTATLEEVTDGEHILYVTKSTHSGLLNTTGEVLKAEPVLAKFAINVADSTVTSVKLISSDDTMSWSYKLNNTLDALTLSINDIAPEATNVVNVEGGISGNKESYAGLTALLNNYDTWCTLDKSGNFKFENIGDGVHTLYVTKNKRSGLISNSGTVNGNEPYFIKVRIVVEDNAVKSVSTLNADDDVTMSYTTNKTGVKLTIDDNTAVEKAEEKPTTTATTATNAANGTNGNGSANGESAEKKDVPVAFILAYVHDGRAAKGCYVFVDDLLHSYPVNNSGSMYCWVPEGDHTIYVTATDPGAVVVAGGDLETSPYLLWKGTLSNTGGKILSVGELAVTPKAIHNIKVSPDLRSMALALVTNGSVSTAVSLDGGKTGTGVVAESMATNTNSSTTSTSNATATNTTSTTGVTEASTETSTATTGQQTYTIVGESGENITQEQTYTVGTTNTEIDKLPQTDIDYLMTVAADYGLVSVDDKANLYVDAVAALDIAKALDTPEAITLQENLTKFNPNMVWILVAALSIGLIAGGVGFYSYRKSRQ